MTQPSARPEPVDARTDRPVVGRPVTFLFVGVGGQGALSAAGVLGEAVFRKGLAVTVSQLHGMSQRGGSVQAGVTVGAEQVLSPLSNPIDVLVGLELLEAARMRERLTEASIALCNDLVIAPAQTALHGQRVPGVDALVTEVRRHAASVRLLHGDALAQRAGNPGALNAVMLGALSCLPECPVSEAELLAAMLDRGPGGAQEVNRRAFALGKDAFRNSTTW